MSYFRVQNLEAESTTMYVGTVKIIDQVNSISGGVRTLSGTTRQISSSSLTGNIVLSLPQNIDASSDVRFGSITALSTSGIYSAGIITANTLSTSGFTLRASGVSGYFLTANDTGVASWAPVSLSGGQVDTISGTVRQISSSSMTGNIVLSLPHQVLKQII